MGSSVKRSPAARISCSLHREQVSYYFSHVISVDSQPVSGMSWWLEHVAVPASFILLGAAIGFILGRINQRLDARRSKKNFLRAIAIELRGLQGHLKITKSTADEALEDFAKGKSETVNFTDSYELMIFTTQLGKVGLGFALPTDEEQPLMDKSGQVLKDERQEVVAA